MTVVRTADFTGVTRESVIAALRSSSVTRCQRPSMQPETGLTMIGFTDLQASPNGEQTANLIAQTLIPVLYADPATASIAPAS
jgi:hypothetical protein